MHYRRPQNLRNGLRTLQRLSLSIVVRKLVAHAMPDEVLYRQRLLQPDFFRPCSGSFRDF